MKVPLAAYRNQNGATQRLTIWQNGEGIDAVPPLLPYCYIKPQTALPLGVEPVNTTPVEVRLLTDLKPRQMDRVEFPLAWDIHKLNGNLREGHNLDIIAENRIGFIDRVLIDAPDFFPSYPNTRPLRTLTFDIEQISLKGGFPTAADPIISVAWSEHIEGFPSIETEDIEFLPCPTNLDDSEMLRTFANRVATFDPDVLVGYNVHGYDIKMVLNRMDFLGLDTTPFSRTDTRPWIQERGTDAHHRKIFEASLPGRVVYDVFDSVKLDQTLPGIKNLKLKTVAAWRKLPVIEESYQDMRSLVGTERLRKYNVNDVFITASLGAGYWPNYIALAEWCKAPLNKVLRASPQFYSTILQGRVNAKASPPILSNGSNQQRFNQFYNDGNKAVVGGYVDIYKTGLISPLWKVDFGCYSDDTEVLTINGWELIKDVQYGDKAATFDPETRQIVFQYVQETHKYALDGELIHIKNRHVDQMITTNHRMVLTTEKERIHILEAEEAVKKSLIYIPKIGVGQEGREIDSFTIGGKTLPAGPFLFFLGAWLGDGTVVRASRRAPKTLKASISQRPEMAGPVRDAMEAMGIHFKEYVITRPGMKDEIRFVIHDAPWTRAFVLWLGYDIRNLPNSFTKRVPREVMRLAPNLLRPILDGLMHTDGNAAGDTFVVRSRGLADDLQEILTRMGRVATRNDGLRTELPNYKVSLHQDHKTKHYIRTAKSVNRVPYRGFVYCLTVKNGTLITRRNGKVTVSGNSMYPSIMVSMGIGADNTTLLGTDDYGDFRLSKDGEKRTYYSPDDNRKVNLVIGVDGYSGLALEIKKMLAHRLQLKKEMKKVKEPVQRALLKAQENAIKVILNSLYGVQVAPFSHYGSLPVGMAVTGTARQLIQVVENVLGDSKVETDTDGIYCSTPPDLGAISARLNVYASDTLGLDGHQFKVDMDEYKAGYFLGKKSYLLLHPNGNIEKHGVALKGSGQCAIFDKTVDNLAPMLFDGDINSARELVMRFSTLENFEPQDYIMRVRPKPIHEYKAGTPIGLQISKDYERVNGFLPQPGETLEYVKTRHGYELATDESLGRVDHYYYREIVHKLATKFNVPLSKKKQVELSVNDQGEELKWLG